VGEYLVCWVPTPLLDLRICGDALVALDVEAGLKSLKLIAASRRYYDKSHIPDMDDLLAILTACGVAEPKRDVALDVGEGAIELRHVCDEWFARDGLQNDDDPHEALLEFTTRILKACGVHVPEKPWMQWDGGKGDDGFTYTITITKRKEGE